ncbi:MAG: FAE1/Type III polyketide synthase-like protein-domain-containing protein [Monoraphidium minutum]|nr:MAG: FAE1/Type III polyketide synthase-like protein-domain-containing protein [Monoraphidium minutum]
MALLVDFSVFSPTDDLRVDWQWHREHSLDNWARFGASREKIEFVDRIYRVSGIADRACLPPWLQPHAGSEPNTDSAHAGREARMVQGQCVAEVLRKTGMEAHQIDILVTNCSIFCPVPSMASTLVNMFGMRDDVQARARGAYHLGGMGCSMGVVGLNLVRDLLAAHPNKIALFVSNEVVTAGFYLGDRKEALITNSLFRMGGAAAPRAYTLRARRASAGPSWRLRAKYRLEAVNRVHTGRYPRAFGALNWEPDEKGINGMVITKDLPSEAALALHKAVRLMAPRVMGWHHYAAAALHYGLDMLAAATGGARLPQWQPDWTQCADKFLIHAGGYAILQAVKKGMRLPADKMMPSFVSLRDYGNTSSASTWYTLAYVESCEGVGAGERVMQIGVGGGMKAGVAVWRALRRVRDAHPAWAHLGGAPQRERDLPRPITATYKSVYNGAAAEDARAALRRAAAAAAAAPPAAGGGSSEARLKISFEPAAEPRGLNLKSWKQVGREDLSEWYLAPPGQPLAAAAAAAAPSADAGDAAGGGGPAEGAAAGGEEPQAPAKPLAAGAGAAVTVEVFAGV